MTAFFTLATTFCLVVLGVIAFDANQQARARQSDEQLAGTAARLASAARHTGGAFRFDREQQLQLPPDDEPAAFVDERGIELASPTQSALPSDAVITRLRDRAYSSESTVYASAAGPRGTAYRWAAVDLSGTSDEAVVIVGAAVADPDEAGRFLRLLIAAGGGLVLLAGLTGHVLSGLAMRPALQGLTRQEQFLREAAHELRTPLAALRMALQTARDAESSEARDAVRRAGRRVDELTRLVDWLLARARSEARRGTVDLRTLRLDQVIDVALDEFGVHPRVVRRLQESVVSGSAELIVQAVRNLVENALRHTDGPVEVVVEGTTLTVADTGAGLSARPTPPNASFGVGSGSGLAIVHWVAEVHGTHLQLERPAPSGLRAVIRFRAGRARPTSADPTDQRPLSERSPDGFVVDTASAARPAQRGREEPAVDADPSSQQRSPAS